MTTPDGGWLREGEAEIVAVMAAINAGRAALCNAYPATQPWTMIVDTISTAAARAVLATSEQRARKAEEAQLVFQRAAMRAYEHLSDFVGRQQAYALTFEPLSLGPTPAEEGDPPPSIDRPGRGWGMGVPGDG